MQRAIKKMRTTFIVLFATLFTLTPARSMTVEEAYGEMQHRHATLDPTSKGFSREEGAYLSRLFELVDLAIVEKMEAWTWFQSEGRKGKSLQEYRAQVDSLITTLNTLPPPEKLKEMQRLLVEAIQDQRAFFETWNEAIAVASSGRDNREAHRSRGVYLKSSSQKLHRVYGMLMDMFPAAGQQNAVVPVQLLAAGLEIDAARAVGLPP